MGELVAHLTLTNGYYECLEHAYQFVSVNMAVSWCQVVLYWLLVFKILLFRYENNLLLSCCAARDTYFSAFIILCKEYAALTDFRIVVIVDDVLKNITQDIKSSTGMKEPVQTFSTGCNVNYSK